MEMVASTSYEEAPTPYTCQAPPIRTYQLIHTCTCMIEIYVKGGCYRSSPVADPEGDPGVHRNPPFGYT